MSEHQVCILLVEDEEAHAELVRKAFEPRGDAVRLAVVTTLAEARACLDAQSARPDLIIADWRLPDGEGLDLLSGKGDSPSVPTVIMTSYGNERIAVEAMKAGALDYIVSPKRLCWICRTSPSARSGNTNCLPNARAWKTSCAKVKENFVHLLNNPRKPWYIWMNRVTSSNGIWHRQTSGGLDGNRWRENLFGRSNSP